VDTKSDLSVYYQIPNDCGDAASTHGCCAPVPPGSLPTNLDYDVNDWVGKFFLLFHLCKTFLMHYCLSFLPNLCPERWKLDRNPLNGFIALVGCISRRQVLPAFNYSRRTGRAHAQPGFGIWFCCYRRP
jgi:hypothetical protein